MSKIDDGGSAFPMPGEWDEQRGEWQRYAQAGMTLRDYFATASFPMLATLAAEHLRSPRGDMPAQLTEAHFARMAYAFADAMMEARGRQA